MPKGGCSRTPQQEERSLSSDMVEKQPGKKVSSFLPHHAAWASSGPGGGGAGVVSVARPSAVGDICAGRPSSGGSGGTAVVWVAVEDTSGFFKDVFVIWGPKWSFNH